MQQYFGIWIGSVPKFFQGDGYLDAIGCLGGVEMDIRGFRLGGGHCNDGRDCKLFGDVDETIKHKRV